MTAVKFTPKKPVRQIVFKCTDVQTKRANPAKNVSMSARLGDDP